MEGVAQHGEGGGAVENPRPGLPSGVGIGLNLCRSHHDFVLPAAQPESAPAKEARFARDGEVFAGEARRPRRAPRPEFGNRAPFSASRRVGARPPGSRRRRSSGSRSSSGSKPPLARWMLVRAALPGMARLREVESRPELRRHRRVLRELLAVVRGDRMHLNARV